MRMSMNSAARGSLVVMLGSVLAVGCGGGSELPEAQAVGQTRQAVSTHTPAAAGYLTSDVVSVAGGSLHGLAAKSDGTVWAWGNNNFGGGGPLGTGNNISSDVPVQVSGITTATKVSARLFNSAALLSNGTVSTWGANFSGQLGNGTTVSTNAPVAVSGLSGVTDISLGFNFALALKSDGTVWGWGSNFSKLGNGSLADASTPVQTSISNVKGIAAGSEHGMAVKNDGTVWVWGGNNSGHLGTGDTDPRDTPVQVSSLSNITAVAAGSFMSLAVDADGYVWAWGSNGDGELGDGTTTHRNTPAKVKTSATTYLSGIKSVSAGQGHVLALANDGTLWSWGGNSSGQLGNGTNTSGLYATQVLSNVLFMGAGSSFSLASVNSAPGATSGALWSWGNDNNGELGNGP